MQPKDISKEHPISRIQTSAGRGGIDQESEQRYPLTKRQEAVRAALDQAKASSDQKSVKYGAKLEDLLKMRGIRHSVIPPESE